MKKKKEGKEKDAEKRRNERKSTEVLTIKAVPKIQFAPSVFILFEPRLGV
jgi:hypothetical protein